MPTKTQRILGYLPRTFQAASLLSALRAVVGAPGQELLAAENSLAALMRAHWVDHADRGAEEIDDLARIAALYGLAPRDDESVEEFREHLKRYVRTFLEGTVTVQGILRVTAEALGLAVADDAIDYWWDRAGDELTTRHHRADDAAEPVLGVRSATVAGRPAAPARVAGDVDHAGGVDLGGDAILRLKVDAGPVTAIDLAAAATLDDVVAAIAAATPAVATHDGRALTLASPAAGPASRLEVREGPNDAAPALLGLPAREVRGEAALAARITGAVDLAAGADLGAERYLRLRVDGTLLAEVDCAGAAPASTTLDEIVTAINGALGAAVAGHDGHFLTLTSPTTGTASSLVIQRPAAQDAAARLFGELDATAAFGRDALPARLAGRRDLAGGVDLSARSKLRLRIDQAAGVVVDCAGDDPAATTLDEIVAAINGGLGAQLASHDGRFVTVTSTKPGPTSRVGLLKLAEGDASGEIFGVSPRTFAGTAAAPARLAGTPDLAGGVDLWARHALRLAVDGGEPVVVDLRAGAADPAAATLDELAAAVDAALGAAVASHDGSHLVLTSPLAEGSGRLAVGPLEEVRRRRFVSRAILTDEAAPALFGFAAGGARGAAATAARITGAADLGHGVDLRQARYLRLAVDGAAAVEIDVAGLRPRATTLDELVARFAGAGLPIASHDGRRLTLTSPTAGAASRLAFEPPRATDALDAVLGVAPGTHRGADATRVAFVGTADLAAGVDLAAGAAVRLGVDGAAPVEIELTAAAAHLSLDQLTTKLNLALGGVVAGHDGARLLLTSPVRGAASRLEFAAPAGADATAALFGVAAPRVYQGRDARPAVVAGHATAGPLDLAVARRLRLAVDGAAAVEIDVAAAAADPAAATLAEVAAAVDEALAAAVATVDGDRLVLTSPAAGLASRLVLERTTAGDARPLVFGDAPAAAAGSPPAPAVLTGEVDLLRPVDLARRRRLRLAVDGGAPADLDVAGAVPGETLLADVVAAINAAVPGLAAATADDRLELTSPTAGEASSLAVEPRRYLEVVEYPPRPRSEPRTARHGSGWTIRNPAAAGSVLEVGIRAPHGVFGAALVHRDLGLKARLTAPVAAGGRILLSRDPDAGLKATVETSEGERRDVTPALRVEPLHPGDPADAAALLTLPRGRSRWFYLECTAARFDRARFDEDRFAGAPCHEPGVFDASHFAADPPGVVAAVFAPATLETPEVGIDFRWRSHQPGAFEVHLPAELPARFGAAFNATRFGVGGGESFEGVALEPPVDADHLVTRLLDASVLVEAEPVAVAPLGFTPAVAPFRKPRPLTLGDAGRPAALYLAAPGLEGFLEVRAREPGEWGNEIAVSVRPGGPGLYDVTVHYAGARFENARQAARGAPLPSAADELLAPGPIGVLQAKAAGVDARVTRERAEIESTVNAQKPSGG